MICRTTPPLPQARQRCRPSARRGRLLSVIIGGPHSHFITRRAYHRKLPGDQMNSPSHVALLRYQQTSLILQGLLATFCIRNNKRSKHNAKHSPSPITSVSTIVTGHLSSPATPPPAIKDQSYAGNRCLPVFHIPLAQPRKLLYQLPSYLSTSAEHHLHHDCNSPIVSLSR